MRSVLGPILVGLLVLAGCGESSGGGDTGGDRGAAGSLGNAGSGGIGGVAGAGGFAGSGGVAGAGGFAGEGGAGGAPPTGSLELTVTTSSLAAETLEYVLACDSDLDARGGLSFEDGNGGLRVAVWTFENLPVGECALDLTVLDRDEAEICMGSVSVDVEADQSSKVNVLLSCSVEPG